MLATQLMRLSQGQLNLLERCPRQFQHTYLQQLNSPLDPKYQEGQTLGSRFHRLMQQHTMGLPIDSFLQQHAQLKSWMTAFSEAAPEIFTQKANSETFHDSEHYRTLQVENYLLTVIYDLLIADNSTAQILDWKTSPKPPNKRNLEKNWQTRLYLYVLAETSEYPPENISMTYWFVQSEGKPQNIKFNYNSAAHEQTAKKLNQLLSKLTDWLERYQHKEQFPQVSLSNSSCELCNFTTRCDRLITPNNIISAANPSPPPYNTLINLATIQEVAL